MLTNQPSWMTEPGIILSDLMDYYPLYDFCLDAGLTLSIQVEDTGGFPKSFRTTIQAKQKSDGEDLFSTLRQNLTLSDAEDRETAKTMLAYPLESFDSETHEITTTNSSATSSATIRRLHTNPLPDLAERLTTGQVHAVLHACYHYDPNRVASIAKQLEPSDGIYATSHLIPHTISGTIHFTVLEQVIRTVCPVRNYTEKELEIPERLTYQQAIELKKQLGGSLHPDHDHDGESYLSTRIMARFATDPTINASIPDMRRKANELFLTPPEPSAAQCAEHVPTQLTLFDIEANDPEPKSE